MAPEIGQQIGFHSRFRSARSQAEFLPIQAPSPCTVPRRRLSDDLFDFLEQRPGR
jgi:hypothetical protein